VTTTRRIPGAPPAATAPAAEATTTTEIEGGLSAPLDPPPTGEVGGLGYAGHGTHPLSDGNDARPRRRGPKPKRLGDRLAHSKSLLAASLEATDRGAPKGPIVDVPGGFGRVYEGGSNHPWGSMLVSAPADGSVQPVINGFFLAYVGARDELGGAPLYEALGRPLGPETAADPEHDADCPGAGAVQQFENGRLYWTPETDVVVYPADLLTKAAATAPPPARDDLDTTEIVGALKAHHPVLVLRTTGDRKAAVLTDADLELITLDRGLPATARDAARSLLRQPDLRKALTVDGPKGRVGISAESLDTALLRTFVSKELPKSEHENAFRAWALKQVADNPTIASVYDGVQALVGSDSRPKTPGALLSKTRELAAAALADHPLTPSDPVAAQRAVMAASLIGLAAHGLQNTWGPASNNFPRFMHDGRPSAQGYDKSWHCVNQAMYAFVVQLDRTYGAGLLAGQFDANVEDTDKWGAAQHVSAAYEAHRGALGSYLPKMLPGPIGEQTVYVPRPTDLSPEEARAYDYAVRIGDAHEYYPQFGDPTLIGANFRAHDPLAVVNADFASMSTLSDPGVTRDLSANRIGAGLGVKAFRDPSAFAALPFDVGDAFDGKGFAGGQPIPAAGYLGYEMMMLDVLETGVDGGTRLKQTTAQASADGPQATADTLLGRLDNLVDELYDTDREKLASVYAGFSVRYLRFGWRVPIDGEVQSWQPHHDFAMNTDAATLKAEFRRRVVATAKVFDPPLAL